MLPNEKSSGGKPFSLGNSLDASQDEMTVTEIISICSNYPTKNQESRIYVSMKINLICHTEAQATLLIN